MDKKIEPTDAMVDIVDLADKLMVVDTRDLLRYALNHPDARGLFADEDALRAAHERGWDEAAGWAGDEIRAANPYRPAQELPEEDGAVIVRKGERIEAWHAGKTWVAIEAVLVGGEWRGPWLEKGRTVGGFNAMWAMGPDHIIPGTWKVDGE